MWLILMAVVMQGIISCCHKDDEMKTLNQLFLEATNED